MALLSQSDVEARLGRNLTAEEATAFATMNVALQTRVERMIGSSLETEELSYRYYDGGVQHLKIDPCTDIARVDLVDDDLNLVTIYDTSDYQLEPVNRTLKTMVRFRYTSMTGLNNIRVQAKFSIAGDTETTAVVKDAMLDFFVAEINNSNNVKRESIEGYTIEFASTEAKTALDKISYLFPEV